MSTGMGTVLARAVIGLGVTTALASGQVVERERDTKVTGPRGRTIERDIKVERGPGYIDRQVEIKRPGETIIRDTRIQTGPGGRPFGPGPGPGYGFGGPRYYGGGPRFVENVIIQRPPVYSAFVGVPALSFFFGSQPAPPPPPLIVAGPPLSPQPPPSFDPFADALGRLKSFHGSSRRDGALTLGRMGDPRAIPALNERLEHDFDKDVRVAAAHALGEIGDERGAVALDKAVLYDKRHEVRDAAKLALTRIPKPGEVPAASSSPNRSTTPEPREVLDPGPNPAQVEDRTPPPPVPVGPPPLEPPLDSRTNRDPS